VERFVEPALLLLLRERPHHGYELIERLPEVAGDETRIDVGNLYRLLRALEAEGVVSSEWSADLPGPARRTWADALRSAQGVVQGFLDRYDDGERR